MICINTFAYTGITEKHKPEVIMIPTTSKSTVDFILVIYFYVRDQP